MFRVFFARTLPASSMPKPHCIKKTVTPAHISQNVSASDAERKIALPVPSSLAWMFATSEATPVFGARYDDVPPAASVHLEPPGRARALARGDGARLGQA